VLEAALVRDFSFDLHGLTHYTQGLRSTHLAMISSLPTPRSISLSVDLTMPSLRFTALRSSLFLGPCDPQNPVSPRTTVVVFITTLVFANRSSVKRIAGFIRRPPFSAFAVRTGHATVVRSPGDLSMLGQLQELRARSWTVFAEVEHLSMPNLALSALPL